MAEDRESQFMRELNMEEEYEEEEYEEEDEGRILKIMRWKVRRMQLLGRRTSMMKNVILRTKIVVISV